MEILLKVRVDVKSNKPIKPPGARYRMYLNKFLLTERFYPLDLRLNEQLEENVYLELDEGEYSLDIENLTEYQVYMTAVSVDGKIITTFEDFSVSFKI